LFLNDFIQGKGVANGTDNTTEFSEAAWPTASESGWGIVKNKNSVLYRMNGMQEHVHILLSLHPGIAFLEEMG
jgi:hypothetical protein